jgi:hypothetical protein
MIVQDILDALSSSEIVEEIEVMVLVQEPGRQAIRAVAKLEGGYVLSINEALGRDFRRYSYHVQKEAKVGQRSPLARCEDFPTSSSYRER